jgi:hypothetical protein
MSTPTPVPPPTKLQAVETAAKADVEAAGSKVLAYVKAHATPTVIGTVAGFAVGKLGILELVWKLL